MSTIWDGIDTSLLPNFLIMGAMKSGTTSLHRHLSQHPDIYLPEFKEPGLFLDYPAYIQKAKEQIGAIVSNRTELLELLRKDYHGEKCFGEASTYYTKMPFQGNEAPANIKQAVPEMKFIYLLRNPYDRMVSHYFHTMDLGAKIHPEFNRFFINNADALLRISCYFYQLSHYLKLFQASQFLILTLESLKQKPVEVLREAFSFLGVDEHVAVQQTAQIHNASRSREGVEENETRFQQEVFAKISPIINDEVNGLRHLTGYDFDEWDLSESRWCA
jgi:hypothetical protein